MKIIKYPLQEPYGKFINGAKDFLIEEDYLYEIETSSEIIKINLKKFQTDFASVPRFLHPIIPPIGKYNRATILHDYMYRTCRVGFSRKEADTLFRDLLRKLGVAKMRVFVMYWGVRLFGESSWVE